MARFDVVMLQQIEYWMRVEAPTSGDAGVVLGNKVREILSDEARAQQFDGAQIKDMGITDMRVRRISE